jgi:hypothetical protein
MDVDRLLRIFHRGTTLARALRGDKDLQGDHGRETARASKLHRTIDHAARTVVGCAAPADCDCPMCLERGAPIP